MSAELKRAIAAACERAYRRGFQHGTLAEADDATMLAVHGWRFRGDQSHAVAPPGFERIATMPSVERLAMEEPELLAQLEESEAKAKEYAAERAVWARQKAKLGHQKDTLKARVEDLEAALRLANDAMNHMGDHLNNLDAAKVGDVVRVTEAFLAVRKALGIPEAVAEVE